MQLLVSLVVFVVKRLSIGNTDLLARCPLDLMLMPRPQRRAFCGGPAAQLCREMGHESGQ